MPHCVTVMLVGAAVAACHTSVWAAAFAHNRNFLVYAPADPTHEAGQALAEEVLTVVEQYRREIALDWLGEELPAGARRTVINVTLSAHEDRGLTWAKDHHKRLFHNI